MPPKPRQSSRNANNEDENFPVAKNWRSLRICMQTRCRSLSSVFSSNPFATSIVTCQGFVSQGRTRSSISTSETSAPSSLPSFSPFATLKSGTAVLMGGSSEPCGVGDLGLFPGAAVLRFLVLSPLSPPLPFRPSSSLSCESSSCSTLRFFGSRLSVNKSSPFCRPSLVPAALIQFQKLLIISQAYQTR